MYLLGRGVLGFLFWGLYYTLHSSQNLPFVYLGILSWRLIFCIILISPIVVDLFVDQNSCERLRMIEDTQSNVLFLMHCDCEVILPVVGAMRDTR